MYKEFLEVLVSYIDAFDKIVNETDESGGLAPYVDHVPVVMEGDVCGFLRDEIGGAFSYHPATEEERAWWDQRPWKTN